MTKLSSCALFVFAQIAQASLEKYSSLVVADKSPSVVASANSIRVTYLGVNGFEFETGNRTLLVDPYFTRIELLPAALNRPIHSDAKRVSEGLRHVRRKIDAILVTHAHFDHLLDVPEIMQRTHARLSAGPTAVRLVESFGISPSRCDAVVSGNVRKVGPWTIRVFAAQHDRLFGKVPFAKCNIVEPSPQSAASREAAGKGKSPPLKASDWCVGEPLAFVIEAGGKRIYMDSGGIPGAPPNSRIGHVDLAILGVALPDSRQRFAEAVRKLRSHYVLPSHQDDMFAPMNRGFVFGKMTNFPALAREQNKENSPGRMILLDYFRPWTLP